jgi:hypothetical protein
MSLFGTILGGVIGGAGNILAAKEAGGDIERQGVLNRQAERERLARLEKQTEFQTPLAFQTTKDGVRTSGQTGIEPAVASRTERALGDELFRTPRTTALSRDFRYSVPNIGAAEDIINEGDQLLAQRNQLEFDKAIRASGQDTGLLDPSRRDRRLFDTIAAVTNAQRTREGGSPYERALGLLDRTQTGDINRYLAELQANQPLAAAPIFDRGAAEPGRSAVAFTAQTPISPLQVDPSSAAPFAQGSQLTSAILAQLSLDESRKRQDLARRQLADAGAFSNNPNITLTL